MRKLLIVENETLNMLAKTFLVRLMILEKWFASYGTWVLLQHLFCHVALPILFDFAIRILAKAHILPFS